ncbi:unnamed protein product [Mycena citricolor]|uniref:Uncharacterized protein n=1 Tax=Mycena citricolor TaxID=2018698 RepID=A0AAD2HCN4_9AGAR|nr:unnamed protein product [Mycena citricolor]
MPDDSSGSPQPPPQTSKLVVHDVRRISHASHDSTRSWVLTQQQQQQQQLQQQTGDPEAVGPRPRPVSQGSRPLPTPPLRTYSGAAQRLTVDDEIEGEHMWVKLPEAAQAGYGFGYGPEVGPGINAKAQKEMERAREREKKSRNNKDRAEQKAQAPEKGAGTTSFVGGFVSGLRRLPRTFVRNRARRGTIGTETTTAATLPQYASNPPTPIVPPAFNNSQHRSRNSEDARMRESPRAQFPSFRVVPPEGDALGEQAQVVHDLDALEAGTPAAMPGGLELAPDPMPSTADDHAYHRERSHPPTTRTNTHPDTLPAHVPSIVLSRAPSASVVTRLPLDAAAAAALPPQADDEPVSINARPRPTEDYRRMSTHISHPQSGTTVDSAAYGERSSQDFSSDTPSFSAELREQRQRQGGNAWIRFFGKLHAMPWVVGEEERITVDWKPKKLKPKSVPENSWYRPVEEREEREKQEAEEKALRRERRARARERRERTLREHGTQDDDENERTTGSPISSHSHSPQQAPYYPPNPYPYPYYPMAYMPAYPPTPPITPPSPGRRRAASPGAGKSKPRGSKRRRPRSHPHLGPANPQSGHPFPPAWMPVSPTPLYVIQATPPPTQTGSPPPPPLHDEPRPGSGAGSGSGAVAAGAQAGHGGGTPVLTPMLVQHMHVPPGGSPVFLAGNAGGPGYAYAWTPPPG